MKTFSAKVKRVTGKAGLYIEVPFDCEEAFGSKGKIKVNGSINGQHIKTVLVPVDNGRHLINLTKGMRVKVNIHSDEDELIIILKKDDIHVPHHTPADLQSELKKDVKASAFFNSLEPQYRRQFTEWIEDAKREETRKGRIAIVMDKLANKQKMK